jgi:hypothetical protein
VALYGWLTFHFYRAWQFTKDEVKADKAEFGNGVVLCRVQDSNDVLPPPSPPPHYAVAQNDERFFELNSTATA